MRAQRANASVPSGTSARGQTLPEPSSKRVEKSQGTPDSRPAR